MRQGCFWSKGFAHTGLTLTLVLALVFGSASCSERVESITVAYSPFESSALFWIAQDQNYFSPNGLNVITRKYDTGVGSLDGMLNGEADVIVGTSEFPLVGRAFQNEKIRTIASLAKSKFIYHVGRKDRGIQEVSDLKGKRIGTTFRTIVHFYLRRFLELNGMDIQELTMVEVMTPEENAVFWSAQSSQPLQTQVISTDGWITNHPELVDRFLKTLALAEEFVILTPAAAKAIVQKQLDLDSAYLETVWSQNQFTLSLDQSLIAAMEDEARWMIENNLTTETEVSDFLTHIYINGLEAIRPNAVNIIR